MIFTNQMPPQMAAMQTPYPDNEQAGYEAQLDDPAIINMPIDPYSSKDPRFGDNLAKYMSDGALRHIGGELTTAIDNDDQSRQKWLRIVTEGFEYLGVGYDKAKTAYTSRSTDIFAPTLLKAALHTSAEIFSNVFPAKGFIETEIVGLSDEMTDERAMRVKDQFNYITTDVMEEYKPDKKQGLLWMALEGSVFTKVFIDRIRNKPCAPYVRASDVIIDAGASSLDDAERISQYFSLSERALEERFMMGDWKRTNLELEDFQSDKVRTKVDQKVGVQPISDETNKYYGLYEVYTYLDLDGFEHLNENGEPSGRALPYIVTKDKNSNAVVAIYRNWNESDPMFRPIKHLVQHKYFTGFNIYGLGLFHLALGLAKAETEIQQQLIKAAQLSNAPSLLQSTGLRSERTQIDIKPGSLNQFQTFDNNIQNALMPLPFKEPSQVLLQLLQSISQDITDLSVARDFKPEQFPANMSATVMLGILSQMHILENSLMNDLYDSFRKEFQLLYNIIGEWLPEEGYPYKVPGQDGAIMKQDFSPDVAIRPVLDPNLSSTAHKLMTGDTLLNLASQAPELYNMREIHKRLLASMNVSDIEDVMTPDPEDAPPPIEMDPISENKAVMENQPIKVYKAQDHQAHTTVHEGLMQQLSQQMEEDKTKDNTQLIAALRSHIQEHATFMYVIDMEMKTGIQLPDDPSQIPPEMQNQIAVQAAQKLHEEQEQQAAANPPPPDPNTVMMEDIRVKEKSIDARTHEQQGRLQVDMEKVQLESQHEQLKIELEMKRIELEEKRLMIDEMKLQMASREAEMRMHVEMERIQADRERSDLEAQSKAYDTTLSSEDEKELGYAKIASDEHKYDLDAQSKSYDSTLDYEKTRLQSQESKKQQSNQSEKDK